MHMWRVWALVLAAALTWGGVVAAAPERAPVPPPRPDAMARVMEAVRADRWAEARARARRIDSAAADIVEWRYLRAGLGSFPAYRAFLARNPGWPGLDELRADGEAAIPATAPPEQVIAYFDGAAPATGRGALALVRAFNQAGRGAEAGAAARRAWLTLPLSPASEGALRSQYPRVLGALDEARLDAMLWAGHAGAARRMLARVGSGWRALAAARLALRADRHGVDALIAAVPAPLAGDPGLAYERFRWRLRRGRWDEATALLLARSDSAASLGRPAAWAGWRRSLARRALREGDAERAMRLAAAHHLGGDGGWPLADLTWIEGHGALAAGDPARALDRFRRFAALVETPISRARAGYWQGRALTALGRNGEARAAFARAGGEQTTFYGLLGAAEAGLAMEATLAGGERYPDWHEMPVAGSSALRAGLLFIRAGEAGLAGWVFDTLARQTDAKGRAALAGLALSLDQPHVALKVAKVAARRGEILPGALFPLPDAVRQGAVAPALALAIARQETEFNAAAISPAGARGLMQLMPATAREVAAGLGVALTPGALTDDPALNLRLGSAYLTRLSARFGGHPALVAAAYNAGPTRVQGWLGEIGDPRAPGADPVAWIEAIPFRETRNYVMRVLEARLVYRARLSGAPVEVSRAALFGKIGG